ncbi:MAG: hypothetical protein FJ144_13055 [Deltaproteobacteria bacterium]|nr:hypothetical protein [Deltaproteobacteria bacterium]
MSRRVGVQRAVLVAFGLVAALAVLEVAARLATVTEDGREHLFGTELLPRVPLTGEQRTWLSLGAADFPYYVPDPELGWTIKPNGRIWDDRQVANADGLRAPRELPDAKPAGVRRVLLAGDSFTHGDEIAFEDTWGNRLEEELGPGWEVWNGAVSGYGTDQAVLRWRKLAPRVEPDVAVLGIYREDLLRNLGIFRPVKHPGTGFPFSKPRFVREGDADGGRLRLANSPVVPPEEVPATLEHFADSMLRELDDLWRPELFAKPWWYASRLARYFASRAMLEDERARREALIAAGGEATRTTAAIVKQFAADANVSGATPLVVLLPDTNDLEAYGSGGSPPLAPLAELLAVAGVPVIDVGPALRAELEPDEPASALFTRVDATGHPNARASGVIAREVARAIAP